MNKNRFLMLLTFSLVFLLSIFFNGCTMFIVNKYTPKPASAEDPPGADIDPENFAYLGGLVRGIVIFNSNFDPDSEEEINLEDAMKLYDFNPGQKAMRTYNKRTVRVPSGERMIAMMHFDHSYTSGNIMTTYYGFVLVLLPPLENGVSYILYLGTPNNNNWKNSDIYFKRINPKSWKVENVPGAVFFTRNFITE